MSILFEEETHLLRRCFCEVQNEVGRGLHETAYHRACVLWFEEHRVPVVSKVPHQLLLRGEEALTLFPDFVAWNAISVELKSVPRQLNRTELVQLFESTRDAYALRGITTNKKSQKIAVCDIHLSSVGLPRHPWA